MKTRNGVKNIIERWASVLLYLIAYALENVDRLMKLLLLLLLLPLTGLA